MALKYYKKIINKSVLHCIANYTLKLLIIFFFWSGRRDSNPRIQPWQGCVLASEIV